MLRRAQCVVAALVVLAGTCATGFASQPPAGQSDFIPVGAAQATAESLPAAPLLIAAYAFVWVAVLGYVLFLWRRMARVQNEIESLERRAVSREGGR
jgi:CcmD family protein